MNHVGAPLKFSNGPIQRKYPYKAKRWGPWILTTTRTTGGNKLIEEAFTTDADENRYQGFQFLLTPWRKNYYKERHPQRAVVIGLHERWAKYIWRSRFSPFMLRRHYRHYRYVTGAIRELGFRNWWKTRHLVSTVSKVVDDLAGAGVEFMSSEKNAGDAAAEPPKLERVHFDEEPLLRLPPGYLLPPGKTMRDVMRLDEELLESEGLRLWETPTLRAITIEVRQFIRV